MSKYDISIIIPTYNSKDYLEKCLTSVINQTFGFENIEVLLVDDKSTDGTKELVKEFSIKYENVVAIFNNVNSGSPSEPRNIGINNATSEYIMFMDNDDYICPDMCEYMYNTIFKEQAEVVSCGYWVSMDNQPPYKETSFLDNEKSIIRMNSVNEYNNIMSSGITMLIWNKIFKKSFIKSNNIKFPNQALYEDVVFMTQVYLNANNIVLVNDFWGYVYCVRTKGNHVSTSQNFNLKHLERQFNGLKYIFYILNDYDAHFDSLECGMLVGWTKLFLLTNPSNDYKKKFLKEAKPLYRRYSLFARIVNVSLLLNICINIFMKIFSSNIGIAIFITNAYNKVHFLLKNH